MLTRRHFLAASTAAAALPSSLMAHNGPPHTTRESLRPRDVAVRSDAEIGSIHIFPSYFTLYFITDIGRAREYHIAVGEEGRNLSGVTTVRRKVEWPSWTPTRNMIRREPEKYAQYADGMAGGPDNPLGARAMYLYRGGRDTFYRIHGTPQPWTIGMAVSSGCIRLTNEDVLELYPRVQMGATVISYG